MSFRLLSITGPDDQVSPLQLLALQSASRIPIEWGILYHLEREGTPRNPSARQREAFLDFTGSLAAHLCGEQVFRDLLTCSRLTDRRPDLRKYARVQVNINARQRIFTDDEVLRVYSTLVDAGCRIILQWHAESAPVAQRFLDWCDTRNLAGYVDVLFDASRGKGLCPETWPAALPGRWSGYAGGLSPQTLPDALPAIAAAAGTAHYWLDMESGIRTDNQFDLDKVRQVIQQVEAFYGV